MKHMKTTLALLFMGLTGFVSAFAYGEETLKVALSTALSGPAVGYGDMHKGAVHSAIDALNARGGVLGKQIEIVEMDDACNAQKTIDVAQQVVAQKINFVLGPLCSGSVADAAKIYEQNAILMIAPTASSDSLSALGNTLFFRTIGKDSQQATAVAEYITKKVNPKALAIIHENQAYGEGLAQQVKKVVESKGLKPLRLKT